MRRYKLTLSPRATPRLTHHLPRPPQALAAISITSPAPSTGRPLHHRPLSARPREGGQQLRHLVPVAGGRGGRGRGGAVLPQVVPRRTRVLPLDARGRPAAAGEERTMLSCPHCLRVDAQNFSFFFCLRGAECCVCKHFPVEEYTHLYAVTVLTYL